MKVKRQVGGRFVVAFAVAIATQCSAANADLLDKFGNAIPVTEGLEPGPELELNELDLENVEIRGYSSATGVVSLEGSTFENSNLRGAIIWASVDGANFTNAIINDARIDGLSSDQLYSTASYRNNDLSGMKILASEFNNPKNWDLSGLNLEFSELSANFSNADFRESNLRGATLRGFSEPQRELDATFAGANFTDAIIRNATLFFGALTREQVYSTASYKTQDLRGVDFRARPQFFSIAPYELNGWNLRGQDLRHGKFDYAEAINTDFSNGVLDRTSFPETNLNGSRFDDSRLANSDFFSADLSNASFTNADLVGADLRGTVNDGTDFRGSDLRNASLQFVDGLRSNSFDASSQYNQWTVFPPEFDPVSNGLTFTEAPIGDLDGNQFIRASDIDALTARLQRGDDIDYLIVESYEGGWVIIDQRYSDFVYVTRNAIPRGISDDDPIYETFGVKGLSIFDATTESQLERYLVSLRRPTNENDEWLEPMFDLNGDGTVSGSDRSFLLGTVLQTGVGDSNLDGEFNSSDLVAVFQAGEYEDGIAENSTWSTGDWDGDGDFGSSDLISAFNDGTYDQAKFAPAAVPEPNGLALLLMGALCVLRKVAKSASGC